MQSLRFDLSKKGGPFKILNATNGGPWHKRHANDQMRSNFEDYKAARIPYSRNHDSGIVMIYGGPYSHDITYIFPDFDADPYDPASYDFACTDESILICLEAGTETFFRLGQTIEHQIKKHGTLPPKDFKKWAVICEHIIRHYNEGWSDGFELNIEYWEIWNEPDLSRDDSTHKPTWGGTRAQFFDFYEVAAKHLKGCFPNLKIGGPAISGSLEWADAFLSEMSNRGVSLDFFSWHGYCDRPQKMMEKAVKVREMMDKYNYRNAESILNEWNYIRGWKEDFIYSIKSIHGLKGSSFTMAYICEAQRSSIDMLMYYDTRPSCLNGVFDFYTYEKLKGYYPLYWYGMFYDYENEIPSENKIENIYSLCGVNKDGKILAVVTYYSDDDNAESKDVELDFGKEGKYEIYLLDREHDGEFIGVTDNLKFSMSIHSSVLIKEV